MLKVCAHTKMHPPSQADPQTQRDPPTEADPRTQADPPTQVDPQTHHSPCTQARPSTQLITPPQNRHADQITSLCVQTIVPMTYVHAGHDTDAFKAVFSLCSFLFEAARRSTDESSLQRMENYLADFQASRHVFDPSVKSNWNSPRIHAFSHYGSSVREFGSLVGMSTAAAETAHIRSCKIPFRRTNKHRVEGQMSTITERTTTLAAHRANLESQGDLDSKKSRQEKAQELNGKIQGVVMKGPCTSL